MNELINFGAWRNRGELYSLKGVKTEKGVSFRGKLVISADTKAPVEAEVSDDQKNTSFVSDVALVQELAK